ncbi:VOC family protein [uncultured Methanoregula sp.]|uniref:VOC family protein n=1 Tax=uncultured Methanoregula sp. TaxID=1005933 RepID=UPI0037492E1D
MVRHVGIVVKKIDDVLPFYRDLLGLKPVKKANEDSAFVSHILGLRGCRLVTVKLGAENGETLIELLEFASHPVDPALLPGLTCPGITHIALTVRDLDKMYRRLTRAGISFISPPSRSPDGFARVAFCKDPAGNYLELVEELSK